MMLLNEGILKYVKFIKVTRAEGTLRYLEGKIGIIRRFLGTIECKSIDNDILLDFIIQQRERNPNITNKTINKYIGTIKQVLAYSCNIKLEFQKLPEVRKMINIVPENIISLVFNYYRVNQSSIKLQRDYLMFKLLDDTGLRISELMYLKVKDFDFNSQTIHVKKTKTNRERYVFFSEETNLLINKYMLSARINNHLFIDFMSGEIIKLYTVESICHRLRKKLDIEQSISPHKWRHTFAY